MVSTTTLITLLYLPYVLFAVIVAYLMLAVVMRHVRWRKEPDVLKNRYTAILKGDFVVFHIGITLTPDWYLHLSWLPVWWEIAISMPRILQELKAHPEYGCLAINAYPSFPGHMTQIWRSYQHLEEFARNTAAKHRPAWAAYYKAAAKGGRGTEPVVPGVGIWHETYKVAAGEYEAVYVNMPAMGMATVGEVVAATGQLMTSKGRLEAHAAAGKCPFKGIGADGMKQE